MYLDEDILSDTRIFTQQACGYFCLFYLKPFNFEVKLAISDQDN